MTPYQTLIQTSKPLGDHALLKSAGSMQQLHHERSLLPLPPPFPDKLCLAQLEILCCLLNKRFGVEKLTVKQRCNLIFMNEADSSDGRCSF
jgi:hypothetical protein